MFRKALFLLFFGITLNLFVLKLGFALDDYSQIVNFSLVHNLENIPKFFFGSLSLPNSTFGIFGGFYKPIFYSVLSVLYFLGNGKPFIFHFFQLALFVLNSILVFFLFSKKIKPTYALFFSLVFLFHPVNESMATYISDLQENLFFFFGMLSLLVLIKNPFKGNINYLISGFLIFLSLLSKETGILFAIIILVYSNLFIKNQARKVFISIFIFSAIYFVLRVIASTNHILVLTSSPIISLDTISRILLIPQVISFYLKQLIVVSLEIPTVNSFLQATSADIIFSWIIFAVFIFTTAYLMVLHFKNKSYWKFLFLLWFLLGLAFHSQIFPLEVIVERRWLYFPIVGILGYLAVTVSDLNWKKQRRIKFLINLFGILILIGFIIISLKMHIAWLDWQKYVGNL